MVGSWFVVVFFIVLSCSCLCGVFLCIVLCVLLVSVSRCFVYGSSVCLVGVSMSWWLLCMNSVVLSFFFSCLMCVVMFDCM